MGSRYFHTKTKKYNYHPQGGIFADRGFWNLTEIKMICSLRESPWKLGREGTTGVWRMKNFPALEVGDSQSFCHSKD